jgi:hypothetical protein
MTVAKKFVCNTCGTILDDGNALETHLNTPGNEEHQVIMAFMIGANAQPPQESVIQSPDGSNWTVKLDNNGIVITDKVV